MSLANQNHREGSTQPISQFETFFSPRQSTSHVRQFPGLPNLQSSAQHANPVESPFHLAQFVNQPSLPLQNYPRRLAQSFQQAKRLFSPTRPAYHALLPGLPNLEG